MVSVDQFKMRGLVAYSLKVKCLQCSARGHHCHKPSWHGHEHWNGNGDVPMKDTQIAHRSGLCVVFCCKVYRVEQARSSRHGVSRDRVRRQAAEGVCEIDRTFILLGLIQPVT